MAAGVNRKIWPNAFVCLQKVHRLSGLIGPEGPKSTLITPAAGLPFVLDLHTLLGHDTRAFLHF